MPKTGLKSFICSFSVSLFAILAANRAFLRPQSSSYHNLNIQDKNIVLFLKNNTVSRSPIKKIALSSLSDTVPAKSQYLQEDVVLASDFEAVNIPLEEISPPQSSKDGVLSEDVVLADVLYSPNMSKRGESIDVEEIYSPDAVVQAVIKPPLLEEKKGSFTGNSIRSIEADDESLRLARAAKTGFIPIQANSNFEKNGQKIKIGNPQDLNHVALNSQNISIQSMGKDSEVSQSVEVGLDGWRQLKDSPWVIAKAAGVSKNQMSVKEFAGNSEEDIAKALNASQDRQGVKIASETVKNLIIPIPGEIMDNKNLTPKLAYPTSSEDAEKEKVIDAELKKQEVGSDDKEKNLLSPIEEDVALDAPVGVKEDDLKQAQKATVAEGDKSSVVDAKEGGGIMKALNSIFATGKKTLNEAKEKAMAKAQAKRSFKKRLAKNRPVSIMPTEIRLSFQPNRAEISGQTLRWVQAFAAKAAEAPNIALEIRIDGASSTGLQQKRLNLLHNILTNKGVEYSKINTVFTSREPNSFILRTVNLGNTAVGADGKINKQSSWSYIQW